MMRLLFLHFILFAGASAFSILGSSPTALISGSSRCATSIKSRMMDKLCPVRNDDLLKLYSSRGSGGNKDDQDKKLSQLGFSQEELKQSRGESSSKSKKDELSVNVTEIEVDPFTLTAIGFALLALNFFVFANAGDGGIAGFVASLINLSRQ